MCEVDFEYPAFQWFFHPDVDPGPYSSGVWELWWSRKLERQVSHWIELQELAAFCSLKALGRLEIEKQFVRSTDSALNLGLRGKERRDSFNRCPVLPRSAYWDRSHSLFPNDAAGRNQCVCGEFDLFAFRLALRVRNTLIFRQHAANSDCASILCGQYLPSL